MNRTLTALFGAAFLCATLLYAQQPPSGESTPPETQAPTPAQTSATSDSTAQQAQAGHLSRIAAGSILPVQLTKTVDAKKAKSGDEVVAKVTEDMKNSSGIVIVPKDTEVIGHVTEAQRRDKQQKESELAIAFDKAVLKNGQSMQMPMSIQAVIATPTQNANQNAQSASPNSGYPGGAAPGGSASPGMPGQPTGSQQGSAGGNAQIPSTPAEPSDANQASRPQPKITGDTKGVVGISNLSLSAAANAQQGSLLTSEKNNVKLESGTFMLLRVNQ